MTAKTMAEVLAGHPEPEVDGGYWYCPCGHDYGVTFGCDTVAAHQAAALSAAGYGLVADAWDEGYTTGNAHNGRRDANPYRKASNDDQ